MSTASRQPVRQFLRMLGQHPALALTAGYLVISLLGISYEWSLFRNFGVNFFHYADVTDFLMGAFREPITFVMALSALFVSVFAQWMMDWEDRWFATREVRSRILLGYRRFSASSFNRLSPLYFFLAYSVLFIWLYSDSSAERLRAGGGPQVTLMLATGAPPSGTGPASLLGTSSRFVFLYDAAKQVTTIVPHENIAWIQVAAPPVEDD